MTHAKADLQSILALQQQTLQQFATFQEQFAETVQRLSLAQVSSTKMARSQPTLDTLAASITEFDYEPGTDDTFEAWFSRYEDFFSIEASELDETPRVRLLLRKLRTNVHRKYADYILPRHPRDVSFAETVNILTQMFGPQRSLFNARYQCLKLKKNTRDDFVTYGGIVNRECQRFQLSTLTEDNFKCLIFVSGLQSPNDAAIRLKLLNKIETEPNVTIAKLVEECNHLRNLKHDTEMVQGTDKADSLEVDAVVTKLNPRGSLDSSRPTMDKLPSRKPRTPCWLCGGWHYVRFCPYKTHLCSKCGDAGHKEGFCPPANASPKKQRRPRQKNRRRGAKTAPQISSIYELTSVNADTYRRYISLRLMKKEVNFQIDTGSDLTIISCQTWEEIGSPLLTDVSSVKATTYGGNPIPLQGCFTCVCSFGALDVSGLCYVSSTNSKNFLGTEWISKLGLYDRPLNDLPPAQQGSEQLSVAVPEVHSLNASNAREYVRHRYPEICSETLGHCKVAKASLRLRPDAQPVFRPKRPVPYAAVPLLEAELDRLEKLGVISRVDYSSWAAPLVVVKKPNGQLRLCADFSTGLNAALEMHQYPLPTPADIFATLNGGTVFSQIDFSDAYLQVEVSEDCRELLTINTHRGLYRYNRLPFGVKSAPGIFQQIMDTLTAGLVGVVAYLDDVIVVGKTEEDHKRNLDALLQRIKESGFHVRLSKCHFAMPQVSYLGCIINKDGRRPDPTRTAAITGMPVPANLTQLRSFLGMTNHYGQFISDLCDIRAPLDRLLRKDVKYEWTASCQKAFDKITSILTSDLLLTHYDPEQEIIVAADASNNGLGAVISHRYPDGSEKAVSHASRTLTTAEKHYSQIEKEALALIFALQKFHKMIHGRKFTLLTDHKPLLAIFGAKKGIPVYTASRLQRWATIALAYDFTVQYRSTSSFGQADALSRLIASHPKDEEIAIASVEAEVQQVLTESTRALPVTAQMIGTETSKDLLLKRVAEYLRSSWPQRCPSPSIRAFFNRRSSLSLVKNCLLYGERVVIPSTLQRRVLRQLHEGHPDVSRMKAIARSHAYWPNIDADIENTVRSCQRCAQAAKSPPKAELSPWPTTTRPWTRVHADYAGPFLGHYFLVVVDSHTKWPEILMTSSTTAAATVRLLKEVFARFGLPETIVTDNGTQFNSAEFKELCESSGMQHLKSPPFHPQSNGQAERFVDTFKRSLLKLQGRSETALDLQTFLLTYRTTPNPALNNVSPAEAMFGRPLRTPLSLLHPNDRCISLQRDQVTQKRFNRRHGVKERHFSPGECVMVRDYRRSLRKPDWTPAKILRRHGSCLYDVVVKGLVWRRHANQVRSSAAAKQDTASSAEFLLFEAFDLPRTTPEVAVPAHPDHMDTGTGGQAATTIRRSSRNKRPPQRLSY